MRKILQQSTVTHTTDMKLVTCVQTALSTFYKLEARHVAGETQKGRVWYTPWKIVGYFDTQVEAVQHVEEEN